MGGRTAYSIQLEGSMNNQCRMITIGDHLRYAENIDIKDDARRKHSFKLDKWNENMMKSFNRNLEKAIDNKDWELVKSIHEKMATFQKDYFKTRKRMQEEEIFFEEEDDNNRMWIMEYIVSCIEKIRSESSKLDLKIINDSLAKKKKKLKRGIINEKTTNNNQRKQRSLEIYY